MNTITSELHEIMLPLKAVSLASVILVRGELQDPLFCLLAGTARWFNNQLLLTISLNTLKATLEMRSSRYGCVPPVMMTTYDTRYKRCSNTVVKIVQNENYLMFQNEKSPVH